MTQLSRFALADDAGHDGRRLGQGRRPQPAASR